ncbi:Peptidase family C25 [uncultured archaeon]|nr:Peptidase family C25 [uncultured archaeon]
MNLKLQLLVLITVVIIASAVIVENSIKEKIFNVQVEFQNAIPRSINFTAFNQENQKIYEHNGNQTFFTIRSNENSIRIIVTSDYQKQANIEITQQNQTITLENKPYDYLIFIPQGNYDAVQKELTDFEKQKINENYTITTILLSQDYAKQIKEQIKNMKPKYALIIASEKTIPQQQKTNPLQNAADAQEFQSIIKTDWITYSDSDYGVIDAKNEYTPETIIGRIPFDNESDIAAYLENLKNRKNSVTDEIKSEDLKTSYYFLPDTKISPPIESYDDQLNKINTYDNQIRQLFDNQLLYITLHGNEPQTLQQYYIGKSPGDGSEVITFDSESLPEKINSIIITDACYSGKLDWQESLTKEMLLRGSPAFLGPTTSALAEVTLNSNQTIGSGSNKLLQEIKKNMEAGMTIGESLDAARKTLDYTNEVNQLTSLQFAIYGDPSIKLTN